MYRHRTRPCASCGAPMRQVPADVPGQQAVLVDVCDRCGCVFLEYFDGEPGALARALIHGAEEPADGLAVAERLLCPDCELPFELRRYLEDGPHLHRCGACLAVFASPSQLRELADHRVPEPPEPTLLTRLLSLVRGRT